MSNAEKIARGQNASVLLQDDTLQLAVSTVMNKALQEFEDAENPEAAWHARASYLAAKRLRAALVGFHEVGGAAARVEAHAEAQRAEAQAEMDEEAGRLERAKAAREAAREAGIATPRGDAVHTNGGEA